MGQNNQPNNGPWCRPDGCFTAKRAFDRVRRGCDRGDEGAASPAPPWSSPHRSSRCTPLAPAGHHRVSCECRVLHHLKGSGSQNTPRFPSSGVTYHSLSHEMRSRLHPNHQRPSPTEYSSTALIFNTRSIGAQAAILMITGPSARSILVSPIIPGGRSVRGLWR
jgi:hypothetical protein